MTSRYELPDITVRQPPTSDEDSTVSVSDGLMSPIMKKRCITWIIIVPVVLSFVLFVWHYQRKRRIEASTEEPLATTSVEDSTKNRQILSNPEILRSIYHQVFEVLGNQTELDKHNLRTVDAVDLEGRQCHVLSQDQDVSRGKTADDTTVLVFHMDREKKDERCCTGTICTVCLESYRTGDVIVWSDDPECCHVYHKECLVDYLSKRKNPSTKENPCPICRRNFCPGNVV
ncbi:ring finger domain containing protein [Nitzschia inconspicua]|uniref:Ring finger domain containing protein n=1 Tax=Nitzschia inconspicua TaxID=303405 RepID=A0A9K3KFA5_9STRA|nr:ring finger domain containing protein [Nitzschia inconspicua]